MKERERRLNQMLRVAQNRMRRSGLSRRHRAIPLITDSTARVKLGLDRLYASDCHIEIRRLLELLGRQDEADAMEAARKGGY